MDGADDMGEGGSDVSLNLRIVTERTTALGVDGHICELQLILLSFAELKVYSCHRIRGEQSLEETEVIQQGEVQTVVTV